MAKSQITKGEILIAHIADTHLRDSQYATSRRGLDFFDGFMRAVKVGCNEADILVICGDIFDRPRPSPRVIGQLMQIDQVLRQRGKPALAITGNHDWSSPTWLSTLFPDRTPADGGALPDDAAGIIPLDGANLLFRGYRFAGIHPYTAGLFRANLAEITVAAREADVVLYHGLVDGVTPFFIHTPEPLHVREFPISRHNQAWLLGDIHTQGYMITARPGGGDCLVGYPGSTEMCSAGEDTNKSVPIIKLTEHGANLEKVVPFPIRPFIEAKVTDEAQLEKLMRELEPVADQHPVVVIQFNRVLPQTINRIHSLLDAQRAVIRCYPLPDSKGRGPRAGEEDEEDGENLGMEHFISRRFEGRLDLQKVALDLFHRGESDASNIIAELIDTRLATTGVRESD